MTDKTGAQLLGYREVAAMLGVSMATLRKYKQQGAMPAPDETILDRPFWRAETITAWQATRPGRGRWGTRTNQHQDGTQNDA